MFFYFPSQRVVNAWSERVGVGNALIPIGGDEKVVLITGDSVRVKSSAATSLDVVMSILEIS